MPAESNANDQTERISEFSSEIEINLDGSMHVSEHIVYDFGTNQRHGIYRFIPKTKSATSDDLLDYELLSITNESSGSYIYEDKSTNYDFNLRIGDPDIYVTGENIYIIEYEVSGALTYYSDHDELYWNVTGTEWQVPIDAASTTITLPDEIDIEDVEYTCYTGASGSNRKDCDFQIVDKNTITIASHNSFNAYEGLTIVVGFTPDIIDYIDPEPMTPPQNALSGPIARLLSFLLFILGL